MRKIVVILGILLTVTILISGSAFAWVYAISKTSMNCTDPDEALGAPDDDDATIGVNPSTLGWILLDLGLGNEMPNSQDFTVFTGGGINETYDVSVGETSILAATQYVGSGWDTEDLIFQTPSTGRNLWRYIFIEGTSGYLGFEDQIYGPEIDAVGWD